MLTNLTLIYEGDGRFRLLDAPTELEVNQAFLVDLTPLEFLLDDQEYAPSEEAVWRDMGMWQINDPDLTRWLAESPEVHEWNQWLYEEPR